MYITAQESWENDGDINFNPYAAEPFPGNSQYWVYHVAPKGSIIISIFIRCKLIKDT